MRGVGMAKHCGEKFDHGDDCVVENAIRAKAHSASVFRVAFFGNSFSQN